MTAVPLPPLPPDPAGGAADSYRPAGRNMVDLLAEEHRRIDALCAELTIGGDPVRRREVAEVLTATVTRHLSAEEQYLYPTVRAALPGGAALADREVAADLTLLSSLQELTRGAPDDPEYDRLVERVAAQLRRHDVAVTTELFPPLREIASDAELIRLGNRVEVAAEAAPTRPHLKAPVTPPWNRVVEPALGVVDKVRDAVTGRRTYLDDLTRRPRKM